MSWLDLLWGTAEVHIPDLTRLDLFDEFENLFTEFTLCQLSSPVRKACCVEANRVPHAGKLLLHVEPIGRIRRLILR